MSTTERVQRLRMRVDERLHHSPLRPSRVRRLATALPPFWGDETPSDQPNTLFSRRAIRSMRGHVQRIVFRDRYLRERLADPRIGGVRDWEYGNLLGLLTGPGGLQPRRALDVGSGVSTFPAYLVQHGFAAEMTTLDLDAAFEGQAEREGVEHVQGSMLDLPFPDASFDLVTCISAIEHLDGSPRLTPLEDKLPYDRYVEDTRRGMREMARVLAPGGLLYVTTDAYLPDRQTTDSWSAPDGQGPIWSAYEFSAIEDVFVATVREAGLELVGEPDFRAALLLGDDDHATYRGRYFTTFAVAARRPA